MSDNWTKELAKREPEAANEIERLEAEIERLREHGTSILHEYGRQQAEIERLRAMLKEIAWHDAQSPAAAIARQVLGHE